MKQLYVINYDTDNHNEELITKIKSLNGDSRNFVNNGWLLYTELSDEQIFNQLVPIIKNLNGRLFVAKVDMNKMSGWLASETIDWILEIKETND